MLGYISLQSSFWTNAVHLLSMVSRFLEETENADESDENEGNAEESDEFDEQ